MIFNFLFVNNTILSRFFLFFLIIGLYVLNTEVIPQIFNPTVELSIGVPTNK